MTLDQVRELYREILANHGITPSDSLIIELTTIYLRAMHVRI